MNGVESVENFVLKTKKETFCCCLFSVERNDNKKMSVFLYVTRSCDKWPITDDLK
jgi:hypothetical protein